MSEERKLGKVEVSRNAIATLAGRAVTQSYGVVGMASHRLTDGIAEILQQDNYSRGVEVRFRDGQLVIDLYVVLEYGTRISEVARNIMGNVKFAVEKSVGLPVAEVNVNVQDLRVSDAEEG